MAPPRLALSRAAAQLRPGCLIVASRQAATMRMISGTARMEHKESTSQNPDPQVDKHKLDSLKKQKEGKGHWKPELASDSEEAVKADRSGPKESAPDAIRKLQDQTKAAAEESTKSGTSMRDGL